MSFRLYVRPVPPLADPEVNPEAQSFNWVLHDASGDTQARGTGDTQVEIEQTLGQNALDNVLLIGLIPGDEALFCIADIPAKQSRFINQALPYAVEEQIAQDIDTVHLALGRHADEGYRVAAIDDERMAQWVALFSGWEHVRLDAIYPDAALLPLTEGGWSVCLDGETALMVSDRGEWLSMQSANLGMFAHTLAVPPSEEVVAEVPVTLYGTEEEFEYQQSVVGELKSPGRLAVHREILELMPLELLAHAHHHHLSYPINLCQGKFSTRVNKTSPLKPWKPLIAVAAVWFGLQVALQVGTGFYYDNKASELQEQAMVIYREAFPGDTRTNASNVRRVIEGQLRVAGAEGPDLDFITLMKYTGQEYSELPGSQSVSFNSVNFSRSRGELVVDVRADSYDRLSTLRNGLTNQGLEAQIGSVVNEASGARGRLTVSGG
ncbi:type II secretion system protein GspL [Marinobacter sp. M216]|uniref:Type II secretion system protein L n=1 Tax=Marinobacter albus TaxID=3030833 RepID=A0ABT7HC64_9GAMM|nr:MULTISPECIES: type II secretion system protein GspL [unclassified Marinobacter]MBW7469770.1 type II secretion system protein GspL [Marinobacter sp. F4218]MDK9557971.1 type II secretion system protein GspL [Marinobacter sp. M216]